MLTSVLLKLLNKNKDVLFDNRIINNNVKMRFWIFILFIYFFSIDCATGNAADAGSRRNVFQRVRPAMSMIRHISKRISCCSFGGHQYSVRQYFADNAVTIGTAQERSSASFQVKASFTINCGRPPAASRVVEPH